MTRPREHEQTPPITIPAGAPDWVTPELLTHTLRVWQPYYVETLTELDAMDILLNAAHLVRAFTDDLPPR